MMSKRLLLVLGLGVAGMLACSADPLPPGGPADSGARDSGSSDSGARDSGSPDASGDSGAPLTGDALPTGAISFFEGACPSGWMPYAQAVGRTLMPNSAGLTGVVSGTPYAPVEVRTHQHSLAFSIDLGSVNYVLVDGCCNSGTSGTLTVNVNGTTDAETADVPYAQLMVCRKVDAPNAGTVPSGLTAYFESASCPATWTALGASAGRFVVGTPTGATNDVTFGGIELYSGEARTHTHPLAGSWAPTSHGIAGASGCCADGYASSSSAAYSGVTGATDASPPYLQLTHCRKQ